MTSLQVLVDRVDNFRVSDHQDTLKPFYVKSEGGERHLIGHLKPEICDTVQKTASDLFVFESDGVYLDDALQTSGDRSEAMKKVCTSWRDSGLFSNVIGPTKWRDELYPVYFDPLKRGPVGSQVAFVLERTCCALFGIVTYGVHMNMYLEDTKKMLVPRRSPTKQTWGGYLDNSVAGGIPHGLTPTEAVIKECEEEASLPEEFTRKYIKCTGAISYYNQTPAGWLQPEVQYLFDLIVPEGIEAPTAKPFDGEVESFELMTLSEIEQQMLDGAFKPNCTLVLLDFMIRHGHITPETEPNYLDILTRLHGRMTL